MKLNSFNFFINHPTFSTSLNPCDRASKYVLSSAFEKPTFCTNLHDATERFVREHEIAHARCQTLIPQY